MQKNEGKPRVTRTSDKRSPRGIRRLGQALIALAQAQLEAEARAQADAKAADRALRKPGTTTGERPDEDASRPTGDAG